eukprot:TRINITY_DN19019_c0_g1_i1.p1 TRINITY_DN19019_c0_g1~~TRINITY_DN19019_c0_g1_i1.p1  ORF type:complete len:595 (+),score=219.44 TRINITY_DN19019_c0_g1_i1:63-1787(+)
MPTSSRVTLSEYDRQHMLSEQLSEAVNQCYLKQHSHPAAFLAEHFAKVGRSGVIEKVVCREILDSRGVPAVHAAVYAKGRQVGAASTGCPLLLPREITSNDTPFSCARTVHRRDHSPEGEGDAKGMRHAGKGVQAVARNVAAAAASCLRGVGAVEQTAADAALEAEDGTETLSRLGANAVASVSLAICAAGAEVRDVPLWTHVAQLRWSVTQVPQAYFMPTPIMWLLAPAPGTRVYWPAVGLVPSGGTFAAQQDACAEVYHLLGRKLAGVRPDGPGIGPGGAYVYSWENAEQLLEALKDAVALAAEDGKLDGLEMRLALCCGASGCRSPGTPPKGYQPEEGAVKTWQELASFYVALAEKERSGLKLQYIEDPFSFDDGGAAEHDTWAQGFRLLSAELSAKGHVAHLAGADLYSTDPQRLRAGASARATSAAVVSLDEAGTVSRLIEAAAAWAETSRRMPGHSLAMQDGAPPDAQPEPVYPLVVSVRPNETACAHMADVAVGLQAHYVGLGGMATAESLSKWDRLREIEEELSAAGQLRPAPQMDLPPPPPHPPGTKEVMDAAARRPSQKGGKKK